MRLGFFKEFIAILNIVKIHWTKPKIGALLCALHDVPSRHTPFKSYYRAACTGDFLIKYKLRDIQTMSSRTYPQSKPAIMLGCLFLLERWICVAKGLFCFKHIFCVFILQQFSWTDSIQTDSVCTSSFCNCFSHMH